MVWDARKKHIETRRAAAAEHARLEQLTAPPTKVDAPPAPPAPAAKPTSAPPPAAKSTGQK